ncbi:trophoblast glycoprotein-like [Erythrolamprus reginae]|uniref:trophoblast glycoprotein-like n=1 Tax=Erythrolamprus reginae TaxID=121349 RepID=UPI00396C89E1
MARRRPPPPPPPLLLHLFFLLLLFLPPPVQSRGCSPCFWFATPDTVQCRFVELQEPPAELPSAVRNLTVVGGNLTALGRAAFAGGWDPGEASPRRPLLHLTLLALLRSRIEALEEAAFAGLPSLAALDLSHNPLRRVSPGAFLFCGRLQRLALNGALADGRTAEDLLGSALANLSLERLEVAGNALRALPPPWTLPPSLQELDARNNSLQAPRPDGLGSPLLRVQLAGNPLTCDCPALRPLLLWLANGTGRAPDRRELRCASPPQLRDAPVLRLRPRQLKCLEEGSAAWGLLEPVGGPEPKELETVSYVFLGIVLALIGLVFLMVLYLNRRGIKRWLNNLREACRDQMEGYQYRYEQDSDPRRSSPGAL